MISAFFIRRYSMNINSIVNRINRKLAGEILTYAELSDFMDDVIDKINTELNTTFPAFSELDSPTDYDFFPDKWIRMVVVPGAAYFYYQADEEGIDTAPGYETKMLEGLFYMKRDYSSQIPEEYMAPDTQGTIYFPVEDEDNVGERGVEVDGSIWRL